MEPLSTAFNVAVITMANKVCPNGYDVANESAPHTLKALKGYVKNTGRILVWSGASDSSIFACQETNWAFRAWHDWNHWRYELPFTDKGEAAVCKKQQQQIRDQYGAGQQTEYFCSLLYFEIMEQLDYKNMFGQFPDNQIGLAKALGYDNPSKLKYAKIKKKLAKRFN